jgi:hypothetical protein
MNANKNAEKGNKVRMERIQTVSGMLRMLIFISLIFTAYFWLTFFFGWPVPFHDEFRIVTSQHHIYTSPSEMPPTIPALVVVRTGLGVFCVLVLNSLFRLYQRGIIFSAKNVRYIRFLGYYLMIDWIVNYQLQSIPGDMDLSCTPLFAGLLVIFVAWIMDEGRKIQEEQELTV